jgi:EKC/KEOPS complex subunit CGI121/TPRKB
MYDVIKFPQFGEYTVFLSYFQGIKKEVLSTVKKELVAGNKVYDFCFLNTNHIISLEHLYSSIYRSISNLENECMRAKTVNTEIIFNLSPINNIMDALKRFGVDESLDKTIVIKIFKTSEVSDEILQSTNRHLLNLLQVDPSQNLKLDDSLLFELVNIDKFKKIYKLNDAKLGSTDIQAQLTRLAVGACVLRGR